MRYFLFLFLLIGLTGCTGDDETIHGDYLVFGKYHGECFGDQCIQIFKIENDSLFADTLRLYPSAQTPYSGLYQPLAQNQFDSTKNLLDVIPQQILSLKNTIIGQLDAADQGGFYIEIKTNEGIRYWLIDTDRSGISS